MDIRIGGSAAYVYTGGKTFAAPEQQAARSIVFVHGAEQDHSCWLLQSRWFAHHGYRVLAPDLPGHGRSGGTPAASIEALADWLAALLEACGVERAVAVGHSMGSLAALSLALRHPQRVERLALLGTAVPMPVSDALLDAAAHDEAKAAAMVNDWSHSPRGHLGGNTAPGMWMMGANLQLMRRQKRGVFHTDLSACNGFRAADAELAGIACPVLVLAGSRDQMTPARSARELAGKLAGSTLKILEGAGHAMMSEQPDAVLDALREFVSGAK